MVKPCDEGTLRHTISRGLEKQRLTKELRTRNQELETLNRELDQRVQKATEELRGLNQRMLTEMASLKEVDELKSNFLDNVSHDMRGPSSCSFRARPTRRPGQYRSECACTRTDRRCKLEP